MKIWIDLTNSPHVNFFKPFIQHWKSENYELIITARNLANTLDLIKQNNWNYYEIGGHAGKNKLKKIFYFPKRVFLLWKFLRKAKPNIGISHSSFYSPIVCKLLKIPSVYLNDNEHAKGNYLAFKYATINLLPEFLKQKAIEQKWIERFTMDFYPGIKEGIYLSQSNISRLVKEQTTDRKMIYIRLEPWTAQYYAGENNFMDDLIIDLKDNYNLVVLPRGETQSLHYKNPVFKGITVSDKPISLEHIFQTCDLFIGAGGSMTRELAFLGVPTISVYQGELLEVDKYLINNNFMFYMNKPKREKIIEILNEFVPNPDDDLKRKGEKAYNLINSKVRMYAKN